MSVHEDLDGQLHRKDCDRLSHSLFPLPPCNCDLDQQRKKQVLDFVLPDPPPTEEAIDHPAHYGGANDPFEPIKIIEAMGWGPGFNKGNALKYLLRAGKKDTDKEAQDLRKAAWYLNREAGRLEDTDA